MNNKKYWAITFLVTLLPIFAGLLLWNRLPDQLPVHFGVDGAADGWSGKGFAVFGIPLMMLFFQVVIRFATMLDKNNQGHNRKVMDLVGLIFPGMSIVFAVIIYAQALGKELNLASLLFAVLGLFFIAMGNWMPKIKQNATLGIKIKWTLYSEENWNKTHRFAGWIWTFGGIAIMLTGFFGGFWIFFGVALLMVLAPCIYSYILHQKGI